MTTTPSDRTSALRLAGEFLRDIQLSIELNPELRPQATIILWHYPSAYEIAQWARIGSLIAPPWQWLAPEHSPPPETSNS